MKNLKRRKELETMLINKAMKDETFRHDLVADPKSVVAKEFEIEIPDYLEFKVIEEGSDEVCLVIPFTSKDESQITDLELENVSGAGWTAGHLPEFTGTATGTTGTIV